MLGCVLLVYTLARRGGYNDDQVRTLTFVALVLGNLALILSHRSRSRTLAATMTTPNPALWWVIAGTLLALAAVLGVPVLASAFRFALPDVAALALCGVAGAALLFWLELLKRAGARTTA